MTAPARVTDDMIDRLLAHYLKDDKAYIEIDPELLKSLLYLTLKDEEDIDNVIAGMYQPKI